MRILKIADIYEPFMTEGYQLRRIISCSLYFVIILTALIVSGQTKAAEFECLQNISDKDISDILDEHPGYKKVSPGSCAYFLMKGRIKRGDAKTFSELVARSAPAIVAMSIVSGGGSLDDAIEIGRIIRRNMIETHAPTRLGSSASGLMIKAIGDNRAPICRGPECVCASSCFLIWLAGVSRYGDNILIHRPYIEPVFNKTLTYQASKDAITIHLNTLRSYLREMEVPDHYFDSMMSIPSYEARYLSSFPEPKIGNHPPSISEWLVAACGSIPNYSSDDINNLILKKDKTSAEASVVGKFLSIENCEANKIIAERVNK